MDPWDRIVPMTTLLASIVRMNSLVKSGLMRIGALVSKIFQSWKVLKYIGSLVFIFVPLLMTISQWFRYLCNSFYKLPSDPRVQKKLLISFGVFGTGEFEMALILSGFGFISLMLSPRKATSFFKNSDFPIVLFDCALLVF